MTRLVASGSRRGYEGRRGGSRRNGSRRAGTVFMPRGSQAGGLLTTSQSWPSTCDRPPSGSLANSRNRQFIRCLCLGLARNQCRRFDLHSADKSPYTRLIALADSVAGSQNAIENRFTLTLNLSGYRALRASNTFIDQREVLLSFCSSDTFVNSIPGGGSTAALLASCCWHSAWFGGAARQPLGTVATFHLKGLNNQPFSLSLDRSSSMRNHAHNMFEINILSTILIVPVV